METSIPDKLYFRIGEVAKLIGVKPYVLRYWETEFPEIAPVKSKTKQRLYKRQDVELICRIRELLYNRRFTIQGAKKMIGGEKKPIAREYAAAAAHIEQLPIDLNGNADKQIGASIRSQLSHLLTSMNDFLGE